MEIQSLAVIALALSLDAFGVAISIGISKGIYLKNKILFALSFGFFQFLFSLIGACAGFLFNTYITLVPKLIGGIIISLVGVLMIKEGFNEKNENFLIKKRMYFVMGISVSIDALVVGFTVLNSIPSLNNLVFNAIFIGITALILSCVGLIIGRFLKRIEIVSKYADFLGGIILIVFGMKMIFF